MDGQFLFSLFEQIAGIRNIYKHIFHEIYKICKCDRFIYFTQYFILFLKKDLIEETNILLCKYIIIIPFFIFLKIIV